MPGDITAALRRIKNTTNVNIIEDKAKVCAMLNDLEPSLHRERRRVKLFYETGAIHSLAKAVSNPEGARLYLSQAASILTDEADMNADAAAETVNYFTPLWNLPRVESRGAASAAIDTDAMFDMMAKQDEEKKKKNAQKNAGKQGSYGKAPAYGQHIQVHVQGQRQQGAAPGMSSAAFTQPLKGAGRQQTTQRVNTYNPTGNMSRAGAQATGGRQQKQRQIYGSYAGGASAAPTQNASSAKAAGASSVGGGTQSNTGLFQRGSQSRWKNIAVKVRQSSGMPAVATSLTMAQQAAEDLCRFYGTQLPACGSDTEHADKLCRRAVWLTAISPARAVEKFLEAAIEGDVSHLSLFGRQILAWPDYLGLETAMGFACLQMAVDRGAERGAFALAHCYHTGTGICKCSELAQKYYHQAELKHPEISEQIRRRLDQLKRGEEPTDKLWRFY